MLGVTIRSAEEEDVSAIVALAAMTPELTVGGVAGSFPDQITLIDSLDNDDCWIVAVRDTKIIGFVHASERDGDRGTAANHACVVYAAVQQGERAHGIGAALMAAAMEFLSGAGIDYVYTWAHPTSGAVEFMEKNGFTRGKTCVWMDKKL